MDQLHLLWEYQKADVEVDKMEASIKRSPVRQKLIKYRDYYADQQNAMKRIESEVAAMQDRLEALKDAIKMTDEQLRSLHNKMESDPPQSSQDVQQFLNDAKRFQNNLNAYEQEIKRIRKDAADRERQQHDVRVRAAKAKGEFDKLKEIYDEEKKDKDQELEALRAAAKEKAVGIEPEYMERYRDIKKHSVPPLAALYGDQCGGCNMSLPSSVSRKVKAGGLVECETCGRLLIIV
ncbi:MAG: hypothetical protein IKQ41_01280 [Clostridia bacterium]|nr:hypothetical protein [Clostridia bacterium]